MKEPKIEEHVLKNNKLYGHTATSVFVHNSYKIFVFGGADSETLKNNNNLSVFTPCKILTINKKVCP